MGLRTIESRAPLQRQGRKLTLPFRLALAEKAPLPRLVCRRRCGFSRANAWSAGVLRRSPRGGERFFSPGATAVRHASRDAAGVAMLTDAGLPTPALLFRGSIAGKAMPRCWCWSGSMRPRRWTECRRREACGNSGFSPCWRGPPSSSHECTRRGFFSGTSIPAISWSAQKGLHLIDGDAVRAAAGDPSAAHFWTTWACSLAQFTDSRPGSGRCACWSLLPAAGPLPMPMPCCGLIANRSTRIGCAASGAI
jgi:hypothetical protein